MSMFDNGKIAGERTPPLPLGGYLITGAPVGKFSTRKGKPIWKINYTLVADLIADQTMAQDPGAAGCHTMFAMTTGETDYVLRDLAQYYGVVIALELGLTQRLDQSRFVPAHRQPQSLPKYPQGHDARVAWLDKAAVDGVYSVEELVLAGVCTDKILHVKIADFKPKNARSEQDRFTTHEYGIPSPKRLAWYREHYLGLAAEPEAEPV